MVSRTALQCRSHAQKFFIRAAAGKEPRCPASPRGTVVTLSDAGSRSRAPSTDSDAVAVSEAAADGAAASEAAAASSDGGGPGFAVLSDDGGPSTDATKAANDATKAALAFEPGSDLYLDVAAYDPMPAFLQDWTGVFD